MPAPSNSEQPTFEAALAELQRIVADLENGSVGLEESLARFERGVALLKTCYATLEQAEQRIELLVGVGADGTPLTQCREGWQRSIGCSRDGRSGSPAHRCTTACCCASPRWA